MKKQLQNPRFYLLCSLITAISAAAIQIASYLTAYGALGANYFSSASPLPKISVILALLSCLFGIGTILTWKKSPIKFPTPQDGFTSLPAAIGFFVGAVLMALSNDTKLTYAIVFFLALAFGYNLCLTCGWIKDAHAAALLGFSAVIGCILLCGYYYFDATLEMNAPVKVCVLTGLLFAMMHYTGELRTLIGTSMPRVHLLLSVCTLGIGALSAVPLPIAYLFGKFDRLTTLRNASLMASQIKHPEYLAGAVVLLGVCITVAWRICKSLLPEQTNKESDQKEIA